MSDILNISYIIAIRWVLQDLIDVNSGADIIQTSINQAIRCIYTKQGHYELKTWSFWTLETN